MDRKNLIRLIPAVLAVATIIVGPTVSADPLPAIDPNATPEEDFENRCGQPGVFLCDGFDDVEQFFDDWHVRFACQNGASSYIQNNAGLKAYPNNLDPVGGRRHPAPDPTMSASGTHSIRLTTTRDACEDQSGEAIRGAEAQSSAYGDFPSLPQKIGKGQTMHAQFRIRFDKGFVDMPWSSKGSGSPKLFALYDQKSCGQIETTFTADKRGFLHAYTNCGSGPGYFGSNGGFAYGPGQYAPISNSNFLYASSPAGTPDGYYCLYNQYNDSSCPTYEGHGDAWWTVYWEMTIGPTYSNGQVCGSHMRAWVSRGDGEPMKQWQDYGPFCWNWKDSNRTYSTAILWLYQTNQDTSKPIETNVWYDELILSTQPLPVPANLDIAAGGGGAGNPGVDLVPPQPPSQLVIDP